MKKMWALVLAVWMVSLNMMVVAEEVGAEPFELKEYHMNLERFRGEPDNMIDSDGNIIFGNAAANKSKTGKNVMLMSYIGRGDAHRGQHRSRHASCFQHGFQGKRLIC